MVFFQFYVKEKRNRVPVAKYKRIENYLEYLEKYVGKMSKKDKDEVKELKEYLKRLSNRIKKLSQFRIVLYVLIYFSFISYVFSESVLLEYISSFVAKMIGLVGTPVLMVVLYVVNSVIDLYYQDMNLLSMHLISIYSKYYEER